MENVKESPTVQKLKVTAEDINSVITTEKKRIQEAKYNAISKPTWIRVFKYTNNLGSSGRISILFSWVYSNVEIFLTDVSMYHAGCTMIPTFKASRVKKYRVCYDNRAGGVYNTNYVDILIEPNIFDNLTINSELYFIDNDSNIVYELDATIPDGYTATEYDIT